MSDRRRGRDQCGEPDGVGTVGATPVCVAGTAGDAVEPGLALAAAAAEGDAVVGEPSPQAVTCSETTKSARMSSLLINRISFLVW